ncbi:MAG: hypothetical protein EGP68_11180 [Lachnospiraceae bacterium]|nr:hypothetical protein [Lachnospiraceae bacterium]
MILPFCRCLRRCSCSNRPDILLRAGYKIRLHADTAYRHCRCVPHFNPYSAGVAGYAEAFIPVQSDSQASEWYSYFENDVLTSTQKRGFS